VRVFAEMVGAAAEMRVPRDFPYTTSSAFVKRKIWRIFRVVCKYGIGKGLRAKFFLGIFWGEWGGIGMTNFRFEISDLRFEISNFGFGFEI
jgi:hypothetical protein